MSSSKLGKMGWRPDVPDLRDFTVNSNEIEPILSKSKRLRRVKESGKNPIDLRPWCSPIEDQLDLGSCTANAGVGLVEYFQRRAFGKHLDASRLFLYKVTRNLMGVTGDQGAYLRDTMKAMVLFGAPPERYRPYIVSDFDIEPPAFLYSFAQSYKSIMYYRLDPSSATPSDTLQHIKLFLQAELPCMFGFSVYSSMPGIGEGTGDIPFPDRRDRFEGGHAVVAVGYNGAKKIGDCTGALLIRNSWGTDWGENGYGWLPFAYVEQGLAEDFWSLVQAEFIDTDLFN
ncbi:cysteine protease [bacterium]|nr:cysteine protease [bacterium]MBU1638599.1 cysteine protease [bacterium]